MKPAVIEQVVLGGVSWVNVPRHWRSRPCLLVVQLGVGGGVIFLAFVEQGSENSVFDNTIVVLVGEITDLLELENLNK